MNTPADHILPWTLLSERTLCALIDAATKVVATEGLIDDSTRQAARVFLAGWFEAMDADNWR